MLLLLVSKEISPFPRTISTKQQSCKWLLAGQAREDSG